MPVGAPGVNGTIFALIEAGKRTFSAGSLTYSDDTYYAAGYEYISITVAVDNIQLVLPLDIPVLGGELIGAWFQRDGSLGTFTKALGLTGIYIVYS